MGRKRPAKAPLSRASILQAALTLIREDGIENLSLRRVAAAVETGPASLYAYFRSREDLLEHALDAAYAEVDLVDPVARDWQAALGATIIGTVEVLESYPGLASVALGTIPTLPGALRLAEHQLLLMEAGGVPPRSAALAVDLIAQFAAATAVERTVRQDRGLGDDGRRARAVYEAADADRYPRVGALAAVLTEPDETARRDFSIGVIIAGIERAAALDDSSEVGIIRTG